MIRHRPEVADVFRAYRAVYLESHGRSTTAAQKRVLNDLCLCRTGLESPAFSAARLQMSWIVLDVIGRSEDLPGKSQELGR